MISDARRTTKANERKRRLLLAVMSLLALASVPLLFAEPRPIGRRSPSSHSQVLDQGSPPQTRTDRPISVSAPLVNLDVVVTDNDGNYLAGLRKENFRVTDDGVRQTITSFANTDAPMTVVLLLESSQLGGGAFLYNATSWAEVFLRQLRPEDWVALSTFSMQPNVAVDFTHRWADVRAALAAMGQPDFRDSNLFDALVDTIERLDHVQGKKSILLLASGLDTFSSATLEEALAALRGSDVTLYSVGVGEQLFLSLESSGGMSGITRLAYLQAQNQLRTFAEISGGRAWFPRFEGQIPPIMADIAASLRNQYSLAYAPSNTKLDGKYHQIKVELVAPDGGPLTVLDQKKKPRKFYVYARRGYQAPRPD